MDVFHMPTTTGRKDSAWEHIENYVKDQRPLQPIRKIVVKGSVDVVFRRHNQPTLIVAGEQPVARNHSVASSGKIKFRRAR